MGKTIFLVRHAKASREYPDLSDWERPLLEAGIERANKVSKILKRKSIRPDKIISSHAFRALNTAVLFALNLDYKVNEIEIRHDIYGKKPDAILDIIRSQPDSISSVMLFGHNPVFTDLYNLLTNGEIEDLSTSATACIHFEVEKWMKINKKMGKNVFIETGKQG